MYYYDNVTGGGTELFFSREWLLIRLPAERDYVTLRWTADSAVNFAAYAADGSLVDFLSKPDPPNSGTVWQAVSLSSNRDPIRFVQVHKVDGHEQCQAQYGELWIADIEACWSGY